MFDAMMARFPDHQALVSRHPACATSTRSSASMSTAARAGSDGPRGGQGRAGGDLGAQLRGVGHHPVRRRQDPRHPRQHQSELSSPSMACTRAPRPTRVLSENSAHAAAVRGSGKPTRLGKCSSMGGDGRLGLPWGANAGPSRESRTRGTASTRSRPWSAQSRRGGPLCAAWAGPRFACTRRAAGASQVLDGELAVPVEEEGEEPKQAEQEGDHRTGIDSGSEPRDQPLARRTRLWRGTGGRNSTLDF
jgi:hypothetical protein